MRKYLPALLPSATPILAAATLILSTGSADAHIVNAAGAGLTAGLAHPFSGLDHLLAMLAVGLWAAQLGGRALWAVPAAFVSFMALGGALGLAGLPLPAVEQGVLASVLILGFMIALAPRLPAVVPAAVAAIFALFHGHAHGAGLPEAAQPLAYVGGFILSTLALHGLGLGLGLGLRRLADERVAEKVLRLGGVAIALAGAGLVLAS